jgi:hypothetical protein
LAATDTVAGNTSGRRQQAEKVEDWSHQPTLLIPTGIRQLATDNCAYLRSFWRPYSISNPANRVFFIERTFMCIVSTSLGLRHLLEERNF